MANKLVITPKNINMYITMTINTNARYHVDSSNDILQTVI